MLRWRERPTPGEVRTACIDASWLAPITNRYELQRTKIALNLSKCINEGQGCAPIIAVLLSDAWPRRGVAFGFGGLTRPICHSYFLHLREWVDTLHNENRPQVQGSVRIAGDIQALQVTGRVTRQKAPSVW